MTPTEKKLHQLDLYWMEKLKDAVADERRMLLAEVSRFEGFLSHHSDAQAAREHNVKELRALVARLKAR